jgi:hypothetical protein
MSAIGRSFPVMPGVVPGIHVFAAIDVVDDARSGIECGKGVIVEQRITEGGRPHAC